MQILFGDLFKFRKSDSWLIIPINQIVKKDGTLVMGKGVAKDAKDTFPTLPKEWGYQMTDLGITYPTLRRSWGNFLGIPTKKHWLDASPPALVEAGLIHLKNQSLLFPEMSFYTPLLGAGLGKIPMETALGLHEKHLSGLANVWTVKYDEY
jgi:hypothetical protein